MDNLEILAGYSEELDEFNAQYIDNDQKPAERPLWPNVPSCCPVEDCVEVYQSFSSFERHWNNKHVNIIKLYKCPNCSFKSAREYNVRKHQEKVHKMKSAIEFEESENAKYINPGDKLPYKFDHRQRMSNKRKAIEGTDLLVRGGQVCRDQFAEEHKGNVVVKYKQNKK